MVGLGGLLVLWVWSSRGSGAPSIEIGVASVLRVLLLPLTLLSEFDVEVTGLDPTIGSDGGS
jgi:hypothetical protein